MRKRLKVHRTRGHRREQRNHQINRKIVDRTELDRLAQPQHHRHRMVQPIHLAMRNGNAAPEAGRTELLALEQAAEHLVWIQPVAMTELFRGQLERLVLVRDACRDQHRLLMEFEPCHDSQNSRFCRAAPDRCRGGAHECSKDHRRPCREGVASSRRRIAAAPMHHIARKTKPCDARAHNAPKIFRRAVRPSRSSHRGGDRPCCAARCRYS